MVAAVALANPALRFPFGLESIIVAGIQVAVRGVAVAGT